MRVAMGCVGLLALASLGACAVVPPSGPEVMAMPGAGKDYPAFQGDDAMCRDAAGRSIGYGSPAQAANESAVNSTVAGTAIGAAAGALIGAVAGNPAAGAAIGAGSGLIVGGATGAANAQVSAGEMQRRYDMTYAQCMAARGNKVPIAQAPQPPYGPAGYSPYYAYPPAAYYPYPVYAEPYPYYWGYGPSVALGFGWGGGGHHGGWHHH